jgi:hypothetical protein
MMVAALPIGEDAGTPPVNWALLVCRLEIRFAQMFATGQALRKGAISWRPAKCVGMSTTSASGNVRVLQVTCEGESHTFDSFECGIHALAPQCDHCGCKIVGHGVEQDGTMYRCDACARQEGVRGVVGRAETVSAR